MDREERQEALEELRKKAAAVAEPIHEMLLQDIVRRVRGTGAITSTAEYQIYRAEQLGLAEKEIKKAISEQLQVSDTVIDALFEDMADLTAEFSDNGQLQQLVEAYSTVSRRAAAEDFDNLWAPGPDGKLYTVKEAYGKIMDFAYMQTATGALDYQTAIRRSLKELLQRGIRTIPRADGRSMRIEYAVRQYLVNRMGEMHNAISQMNYETIGADGWEISAHAAPAPDHAPYQGHQYSAEEYEQVNGSLERKFGWWGCMHTVYPILLGISEPAYSDEQLQRYLDENEAGVTYEGQHYTLYEAKARKRQLESLITSTKYDVMAAEGDPEWLRTTQLRLSRIRQEYNRFCQATGQTPEPWRTMAAEYGRSRASRDAWAARKLGIKISAKKHSPKMASDAILAAGRTPLTKNNAQQTAMLLEAGIQKYTQVPSAWNCKVRFDKHSEHELGSAEWDGTVSLSENADTSILLHELLHMRSANRFKGTIYAENVHIEEGVVQLLTEEICRDNGLPSLSAYSKETALLRGINKAVGLYKTDLEFAVALFEVELDQRYDWLLEHVEDTLASKEISEDVKGAVKSAVHMLWGSDPI
ncbi:hypothetical protein B5E65_10030 [Gemmiger sp. An120]|uniref:phage minor capsid protein n=1 Tax=Gemmiger sp. An120 TaxID=1965549 RepID=UPI000B3ADC8F|nr:phage minor capsid protein [Gemmiger sp. An120]OUQ41851.1 hypothetical protein B5E65_10030 [Gemmiger sp. An120]